jgi:hypothetical protein
MSHNFDLPVLQSLLEPVSRSLNTAAAKKLAELRLDAKAQANLDRLARKCSEGKLTSAERVQYETYVYVIDFIGILQAQARAILAQSAEEQ